MTSEKSKGPGDTSYERARRVLRRNEADLLRRTNVVGVGVGEDESGNPIVVVLVREKVAEDRLPPGALVPASLEGIRVDVREIGDVRAQGGRPPAAEG